MALSPSAKLRKLKAQYKRVHKSAVYEVGRADKHGKVKKWVKLIHFSKVPKLNALKAEIRKLERQIKRKVGPKK
jgi:hypothetical protein